MLWPGGRAVHARLGPIPSSAEQSESTPYGVCVSFNAHRQCGIETERKYSRRNVPQGGVSISGPKPVIWLEVREPSDVVEIVADEVVRRAMAAELRASHALEVGNINGEQDPIIWAVAVRFRSLLSCRAGEIAPSILHLECDELLHLLYRHVFITRLGGKRAAKGDGALDVRRQKRVFEYVDANLDLPLTINHLAAVAALSPFHFIRSFKRTTGVTPHQFVQYRRMERARVQLQAGADIRAVARVAGLSHVRHFRAVYFRHLGLKTQV